MNTQEIYHELDQLKKTISEIQRQIKALDPPLDDEISTAEIIAERPTLLDLAKNMKHTAMRKGEFQGFNETALITLWLKDHGLKPKKRNGKAHFKKHEVAEFFTGRGDGV